jgi:hypothetical protein
MKKSASKKSNASFQPGEHVRVVPLYHPKPAIPIGDLARARAEDTGDLFDGKPHGIPASAKLTYRGGSLIPNVEVFTVFWGKLWSKSKTSIKMMADLNKFFTVILTSPAIDQLAEYSIPKKQTIGHGSLIGTKAITANAPVGSVTDSTIQTQLKAWIAAKTLPQTTKNTLYFIYLDPGIVSIMGGSQSCKNYCGYHDAVGKVYYAVMPYPTCSGCLGAKQAFDALTGTSSHELCEAITDPVPGKGWYDNTYGEIGDICAWNFKTVSGYNVQLEWSNKQNKCV